MGITYKAEDLFSNGEQVAIKAMSLGQIQDWKALELFEREAKVLETLHHPAIPRYFNYFQVDTPSDRAFYLVQELAEGQSLASLVEQGWRATEADVQWIAIEVLEILIYLQGLVPPVIHRDIKPRNLILHPSDRRIFLVDFGSVQAAYHNTFAAGSTIIGTFGYMPPEIFQGKAVPASDLFSLGATLLFLLTHRSPADLPQTRLRIDFRSQVRLSEKLATWLEKMLEPALEDRFQSATEALQALCSSPQPISSSFSLPLATSNLLGTAALKKLTPCNSRILIHRTETHLIIKIPSRPLFAPEVASEGWLESHKINDPLLEFLLGFLVLPALLIIALCLISIVFPNAELMRVWFGMILTPLIILLVFKFINFFIWPIAMIVTSEYLEINRNSFRIGYKFLGFTKIREEIISLRRADLDGLTRLLVLYAGYKKYRFGFSVTIAERYWLKKEISYFLRGL
jgi:serine/threonine protein kinase